jgi:hypothetical protein
MNNNSPHKARAAQEPGLVSLDLLPTALAARWTIGALGRQRLYILSGRFGTDRRFCSRYVVFPEALAEPPVRQSPPRGERWLIHVLHGEQDYTKGRLDLLQDKLTEPPDSEGRLPHGALLGTAEDAQQAQQDCVEHALSSGIDKAALENAVLEEELLEEPAEALAV